MLSEGREADLAIDLLKLLYTKNGHARFGGTPFSEVEKDVLEIGGSPEEAREFAMIIHSSFNASDRARAESMDEAAKQADGSPPRKFYAGDPCTPGGR
ncbi:MAG: hypothetical protein WC030_01380 [Candidatus Paceibacterota bacterium]